MIRAKRLYMVPSSPQGETRLPRRLSQLSSYPCCHNRNDRMAYGEAMSGMRREPDLAQKGGEGRSLTLSCPSPTQLRGQQRVKPRHKDRFQYPTSWTRTYCSSVRFKRISCPARQGRSLSRSDQHETNPRNGTGRESVFRRRHPGKSRQ